LRVLSVSDTPVIDRAVEILEIGADYVIGLWRHEDDVELICAYSLIKPESSATTGAKGPGGRDILPAAPPRPVRGNAAPNALTSTLNR
jgi:hypothetical protein